MSSLALRVPFREEEPAYGLLGRIALRHGRADLRTFAGTVGLAYGSVIGGGGIDEIARLSGFETANLLSSTSIPDWHARHFREHRFHNNDWFVHDERRICVACLRDDVRKTGPAAARWACCHRRFWWDLRAIDVCPRHAVWLIDRCPRCERGLTLATTDVRRCACGVDLASLEPVLVERLDVRADAYILARLLGRPHRAITVLDAMPIRHATALMYSLGWQLQGGRSPTDADAGATPQTQRGVLWKRGASREAKLAAKMNSFKLLRRWPREYHRFLDDLFSQAKDNLGSLARRDNGSSRAYRLFGHRLEGWSQEGIQPLRDEYEAHFLGHVAANAKTTVFGRPATTSRYVTIEYANELCGLTQLSQRMHPILYDLRIIKSEQFQPRRVRIPRALLPTIKSLINDALTLSEAGQLLGISTYTVPALVEAGILTPQKNILNRWAHHYSREEIEYLIFDLLGANPRQVQPGSDLIDVVTASRSSNGYGYLGLVPLLRALARRTMAAVGVCSSGSGLATIYLRRKDVERLVAKTLLPKDCTPKTACTMLRITRRTFDFLVNHGVLEDVRTTARVHTVTLDSVKRFQKDYVSAVDLGKALDLTYWEVVSEMRSLRHDTAFDPKLVGTQIYRRTDALQALAAAGRSTSTGEPPDRQTEVSVRAPEPEAGNLASEDVEWPILVERPYRRR